MGFRDLDIRNEYRTKLTNIARSFLVPLLSESITYKRAVGFFSSSSLAEVALGIGRLAETGGHIYLIASPNLTKDDVNAISKGYEAREEIIRSRLLESLESPDKVDDLGKAQLNMLANLIAQGILDIRIAFAESKSGIGIYHEKVAIVEDRFGDKVAFSGSMNETGMAMSENYETIDVFKSWNDPEKRVEAKDRAFDAIWTGSETGVSTFDFPEVKEKIVKRYLVSPPQYHDDLIPPQSNEEMVQAPDDRYPKVPDEYKLRGYQEEAIKEWERHGYRGIYDMATGTGKTVTALASIVALCNALHHNLAAVIVCPYQHLVDQWVEDIELFNIRPIIAYSTSPQKDWLSRLDKAVRNQRFNVDGASFFCLVCTNGTFATDRVQRLLDRVRAEKLLVVDEAHNFGAEYLRSMLKEDYQYRLALSATIVRYGDEEGTDALFRYFGDRCIEYTLEEAIYGRGDEPPCLTPYRYYPIIVRLQEDELEKYSELSAEIARCMLTGKDGGKKLSERGKRLVLKRSRIVAAAHEKLSSLKTAISNYVDEDFILVYCGATKVTVDSDEIEGVDDYEVRQIEAVTHILGDELGMRVRQFTSRENSAEREQIKQMFSDGQLQALIAIKCLDEGVNIPMIKTAFILASTTNPREYVQRRGRLLRRDKRGIKKRAEIFDFITLPRDPDEASVLPDEDVAGERRLVCNELKRAKEFASLAENRAQVLTEIESIEEAFFGLGGLDTYETKSEVE